MNERVRLSIQLVVSLAILAWIPGNIAKLLVFMIVWIVTFQRIDRAELTLFVLINALFAGMNAGALRQGVFRFEHPDFLGMPIWEFAMWGFYVLHLIRMVGGPVRGGPIALPLALAIVFAVPFSTISDQRILAIASGLLFLVALGFLHDKFDLAYAGYMILVGAFVEYVGVHSGQWSYPGDPPGGVPLWFIPMWGGVGLFTRRLVLPLLERVRNRYRL